MVVDRKIKKVTRGSGYQGVDIRVTGNQGKTVDRKRRPETPSIEVTVASKGEKQ